MNYICSLKNIKKSYNNKIVINNINLNVKYGELLAITGKSGAGKSTLLNIIGLIENLDSGTLELFGEKSPKIGSSAHAKLLRNKISYLFQNFGLIDNESIENNLEISLEYTNMNKKEKKIAKLKALEEVGLNIPLEKKIYQLSGGEQQRVALARIILKPCELILADEPTGALDKANRDLVMEIIKDINKKGKSIIIVTHDSYVASLCDRIITIQ